MQSFDELRGGNVLKNREVQYSAFTDAGKSKKYVVRTAQNRIALSCLDKKHIDKKKHKVVGYVRQVNRRYTGREFATLTNVGGSKIDIYSRKRLFQTTVAYIQTSEDEFLALTQTNRKLTVFCVLCVFIGAPSAAAASVGGFQNLGQILSSFFSVSEGFNGSFWNKSKNGKTDVSDSAEKEDSGLIPVNPFEPDPNAVDIEKNSGDNASEEEQSQYRLKADVILPEGSVRFEGSIYKPKDESKYLKDADYTGKLYTGQASIKVLLNDDAGSHVLLNSQDITVTDGVMADTFLDFSTLNFEVKPDFYDGVMEIKYQNGTELDIPMNIVVRSSLSGNVGISYSDKVNVNLDSSEIELQYSLNNSPNNTYAELVIQSEDNEYVISRSGSVSNGQMLTKLILFEDMKSRLQKGTYSGVIRVYVITGENNDSTANIHTDIQVTISVE